MGLFRLSSTNIYEVNFRQYTPEGTFRAFAEHLPRLKNMGIEILWFMPVYPIGRIRRKGILGSYYSISDFTGINPEFGNADDFKFLVHRAHELGMKVMLDWVANHAAWDNRWTIDHPGFFVQNEKGEFVSPYNWDDVIQIDHGNVDQQEEMIRSMEFWVKTFNIDGFRADLAHLTPLDFWRKAKARLQKLNPSLVWLAESEEHSYHEVFDIIFTWKWMHTSEDMVKNRLPVQNLADIINEYRNDPPNSYRLYFTGNHDENSWNGTEYEKYGVYAHAFAVISCLLPASVPLIYSGQEIPNHKRLKFFEKDDLNWNDGALLNNFYQRLLELRKHHPVFSGDPAGIEFLKNDKVLCYRLTKLNNTILVILNLSEENQEGWVPFEHNGKELFTEERINNKNGINYLLNSGEFKVFYSQ